MDFMRKRRTQAEFERFVIDQGPKLLRTAYLMTADAQEAEELVQECLLRVARHWQKVRGMGHAGPYAQRALVNLTLDGSKRRSRQRQELETPGALSEIGRSNEDDYGSFDVNAELRDALRELPARQRAALVLRYFCDLSETQTAEALGCSIGTVKSTTSRALARLRETLDLPVEDHNHTDLPPTTQGARAQ
jgi:RNA polymerase sigma-70 factor (sigma-E family)